jgi:putative acetyltransferase
MSVGDLGAAASARTSMKIGPEDVESEDARELVAELDELLNGMYAVGQDLLELPPRDVAEGQGTLLVARDDAGRALGCGAIRRIAPVTGELKRMYVRPLARRRGVGGAILEALERWAAQAGLQRIVLERVSTSRLPWPSTSGPATSRSTPMVGRRVRRRVSASPSPLREATIVFLPQGVDDFPELPRS